MIRLVIERRGGDGPAMVPMVRTFPGTMIVLGRSQEADWTLAFPDVSRRHCRITRRGDAFFVEGLSSRSPVYLNKRRITGVSPLRPGDRVRFGLCVARVGVDTSREETATPSDQKATGTVIVSHSGSEGPTEAPPPTPPRPPDPVLPRDPVLPPASLASPGDLSGFLERSRRWYALDCPPALLLAGRELRQLERQLRQAPEAVAAAAGTEAAGLHRLAAASAAARRGRLRSRGLTAGVLASAGLSGVLVARVLAGDLSLPDLQYGAGGPGRCHQAALKDAQGLLARAREIEDSSAALLGIHEALRRAERTGCPGANAPFEQALRERLGGVAPRILGSHRAGEPVIKAATTRNSRYTATIDQAHEVRIWDHSGQSYAVEIPVDTIPTELAWSVDSRQLLIADDRGGLAIWRISRGSAERLHELPARRGRNQAITAIAVDPSGELVAAGDQRGEVRLWRLDGDAVGESDPGLGAVHSLDFDGNGGRLVVHAGESVGVWPVLAKGKGRLGKFWGLPTDHSVTAIDLSRDGDALLVGDASGLVYLWSVTPGKPRTRRPRLLLDRTTSIAQVALVPTREAALVATSEGELLHIDLQQELRAGTPQIHTLRPATGESGGNGDRIDRIDRLVVDPSGSRALTVGPAGREIWELDRLNAKALRIADSSPNWTAIAPSPGHSRVAVGDARGQVALWDLRDDGSSQGAYLLTDHGGPVEAVAFSSDGATVVSGGADGVVRRWTVDDTGISAAEACAIGTPINHVAIHGDQTAASTATQVFRCVTRETDETSDTGGTGTGRGIALDRTYNRIHDLQFSRDGQFLVALEDRAIIVWQEGSTTQGSRWESPQEADPLLAIALAEDQLAFAAGALMLLPLPLGERPLTLDDKLQWTSVATDDAGRWLAGGSSSGEVALWDLQGERDPIYRIPIGSSVEALGFAPQPDGGALLAAGGGNGDLYVFQTSVDPSRRDAATHWQLKGGGHRGPVSGLAFTHEGTLVSVSQSEARVHHLNLADQGDDAVDLRGHRSAIIQVAGDRQGRFAATTGDDGLRVWPLRARELRLLVCDRVDRDLEPEALGEIFPNVDERRGLLCSSPRADLQ